MEIGDCVLLMEGHTAAVTDLAVAREGSVLVTSSADHTARVWGLDKGQSRAVLQGHTAAVNAVAVDVQGRFAVTVSADATGRVWDLHSGQCAHVLRGHGAGGAGELVSLDQVLLLQGLCMTMAILHGACHHSHFRAEGLLSRTHMYRLLLDCSCDFAPAVIDCLVS